MNVKTNTSLKAACDAAGSQRHLGIVLGVTEAAVSGWVKQGWVPLRRATQIADLYGLLAFDLVSPVIQAIAHTPQKKGPGAVNAGADQVQQRN